METGLVQPPDTDVIPSENIEPQISSDTRRVITAKPLASSRRKREFISQENKDASYWEKRRKNNEAAKRSREKRRLSDMVLEKRVTALNQENLRLKTELLQLKFRFGLIGSTSVQEKTTTIIDHSATDTRCIGTHNPTNTDSVEAELIAQSEASLLKHLSKRSPSDFTYQSAPNQRSVILHSSSSNIIRIPEDSQQTGSEDPPQPHSVEILSKEAQQLVSGSPDEQDHRYTCRNADVPYILQEHHVLEEAEAQYQKVHHTDPFAPSDREVLREHRISSPSGDPHSSDKDTLTLTDEESLSSSSSEIGQSTHTAQLPHKLRLKHRAVSIDDSAPITPSASSELLRSERNHLSAV
ncbi:Nuclear factor interleukin-3-regulated protein [Bagarius yarrelli]|uniref:Nuclear factor interleukin-3-regulated protein n=1 Tax=Bagarius yarrelli TaxID=175774 RepID=A0A556VBY7_BAGYA|nr:Nuclear factor interleukin-3-regulated protein [Bagarius yarrelli]